MAIRFRPKSMFPLLVQQLLRFMQQKQTLNQRKRGVGCNRCKPYSAIATLAFAMFRWLFLFCMGMALLVLFVGFTISHAVAESIFAEVMPIIKVFGSTTFVVFACACLKESI